MLWCIMSRSFSASQQEGVIAGLHLLLLLLALSFMRLWDATCYWHWHSWEFEMRSFTLHVWQSNLRLKVQAMNDAFDRAGLLPSPADAKMATTSLGRRHLRAGGNYSSPAARSAVLEAGKALEASRRTLRGGSTFNNFSQSPWNIGFASQQVRHTKITPPKQSSKVQLLRLLSWSLWSKFPLWIVFLSLNCQYTLRHQCLLSWSMPWFARAVRKIIFGSCHVCQTVQGRYTHTLHLKI